MNQDLERKVELPCIVYSRCDCIKDSCLCGLRASDIGLVSDGGFAFLNGNSGKPRRMKGVYLGFAYVGKTLLGKLKVVSGAETLRENDTIWELNRLYEGYNVTECKTPNEVDVFLQSTVDSCDRSGLSYNRSFAESIREFTNHRRIDADVEEEEPASIPVFLAS